MARINKFNDFDKVNESSDDNNKIRKEVRDYFFQKIVYNIGWMISSESDIQDELIPILNEQGLTFNVEDIKYDEKLLNKVVDQITDSIMNNLHSTDEE